jgi:hypothetical protein
MALRNGPARPAGRLKLGSRAGVGTLTTIPASARSSKVKPCCPASNARTVVLRRLREAPRPDASVIVLKLGTPGGLDNAKRDISALCLPRRAGANLCGPECGVSGGSGWHRKKRTFSGGGLTRDLSN